MSQATNASNIAFSSAFAVDKIVGIFTGSYTSGTQTTTLAGYLYQFAIPHSFTRPVFTELLWSTDGITYVDGGAANGPSGASGISYSDSSNIYVTTSLNAGTIFYKVIASWIDNFDGTNPLISPVLNTTNRAYFDSRQNYQKTYLTGTLTASTLTSDNIFTVTHGLGYTPNAKIYFESITNQVWPQIAGGTNDFWLYDITQAECFGVINSQTLIIDCAITSKTARIWYRIYLDH